MTISRQVLEAVAAHAGEAFPRECCGVLLDRPDDPLTASHVLRAENVEQSHPDQQYVLGHKAHLNAVQMESLGEAQILGYYHSHPNGGEKPSRRDKEQAVAGVTYLIVAVCNGVAEHAAWRLKDAQLVREPLEVRE